MIEIKCTEAQKKRLSIALFALSIQRLINNAMAYVKITIAR